MGKVIFAAVIGIFLGWYVMDHKASMAKCMEVSSYETCAHILR